MHMKLGAAVAAATMALGALPAAAGTFVFDVTVTGPAVLDLTGCGCDVTRFESAVLPPTFQVSFQTFGGYDSAIYGIDAGGVGSIGITRPTTPLTSDLLALSQVDPSTIAGYLGVIHGGTYSNFEDSVNFGFDATINNETVFAEYSIGIGGVIAGSPTDYLGPFSDQATDQLLRQIGTLTFTELGDYTTFKPNSDGLLPVSLAEYVGTAVYRPDLSVIPEPAQWILMIAGFGLAGAALRRRATAGAV